MEQTPTPRRRPPLAAMRVMNPVMKTLLRSPLHRPMSKRLIVLSFTGRKSGKSYSIPVGYVQTDPTTLLTATNSAWWKNLRGGAKVKVRLRGKSYTAVTNVTTDVEGLQKDFRDLLADAPQLRDITGVRLDAQGEPIPADVEAARRRGFAVVRITLDRPA
ncbi:MAG: nitroreductase/quinone reductase family protein [Anaerolineae bacterium]